jgi:hypothetical protein
MPSKLWRMLLLSTSVQVVSRSLPPLAMNCGRLCAGVLRKVAQWRYRSA